MLLDYDVVEVLGWGTDRRSASVVGREHVRERRQSLDSGRAGWGWGGASAREENPRGTARPVSSAVDTVGGRSDWEPVHGGGCSGSGGASQAEPVSV